MQEAVRRAVRGAANEAWGKKPLVTVFVDAGLKRTGNMLGRLNHVAIAVPDLAAATRHLPRHARRQR